jgi:hypothetical protein
MDNPEEMPYCIWYPGLATEDTYRELARRYPTVRYQVGRACAVGGYSSLFLELDLLPDATIAEEAREAGNAGSVSIFEHIMSRPARYAVMNDYDRTVDLDNPRAGVSLNGDTAVRPSVDQGPEDSENHLIWPKYFDITEEWPNGKERPSDPSRAHPTTLPREFTYLLYSPLPLDLPTTLKDALIVMAAYEGNVDRYHRLKRPTMVHNEAEAIIRGIYHSTSFANYWSMHGGRCYAGWYDTNAIMARFTMVNDLSFLDEDADDKGYPSQFPHMIWHLLLPCEETLREIIRRRPNNAYLKESVAIACIAANYHVTYAALNAPPTMRLWQQALKSPNPFFVDDLKKRAATGAWPGGRESFPEWCGNWYEQQALDMTPTTTLVFDRHIVRDCGRVWVRGLCRALGAGGECRAVGVVHVCRRGSAG